MNWDLGERKGGGSINSRERNITGNLQKKPMHRKEVATEIGKVSWGLIAGGLESQNLSAKSLGQSKILNDLRAFVLGLPTQFTKNHVSVHKFIP